MTRRPPRATRTDTFFPSTTRFRSALDQLAERGARPTVLFLEASDETLVRRFESARRPHPLQGHGRVVEAITQEREQLSSLRPAADRSEEHTSELQSLMRISYAVFCLKKKKNRAQLHTVKHTQ